MNVAAGGEGEPVMREVLGRLERGDAGEEEVAGGGDGGGDEG